MNLKKFESVTTALVAILISGALVFPIRADAHCDRIDGPVVQSAQRALETADIHHLLIWVKKEYEEEIRESFRRTLIVRNLGKEARRMADTYFFETLVRLHREGEGAPYTGLKPAESPPSPIFAMGDRAISTGSGEELARYLEEAFRDGIHRHFNEAMKRRDFPADDIEAGRAFVEAYVAFMHYIEPVFETVSHRVGDVPAAHPNH